MKKCVYFIINSLGGGGAERVCVTLANELNKSGIKVKILIFNRKNNIYEKYVNKDIEIINLGASSTLKGYFLLLKFLIYIKPSNVLAFTDSIASICVLYKKLFHGKIKIVARNINNLSLLKSNAETWKEKVLFLFVKILYPYVDMIIAQCVGMKNDLVNNWEINSEKVVVINNPISDVIYRYSIDNFPPKDNQEFLFIGRLEKQKGLEYLIEATKICIDRGYDFKVKVIGTGSLEENIKEKIKINKLERNIILLGHKSNVEDYYIKAKAVVLSSIYEGFPNVLIEAITLGIPVVAFDCPSGPNEIITENNGFLVKYLDSEDLANKMIEAFICNWDIEKIRETSQKYRIKSIIAEYKYILNQQFIE